MVKFLLDLMGVRLSHIYIVLCLVDDFRHHLLHHLAHLGPRWNPYPMVTTPEIPADNKLLRR